ncbi:hypothetical protein C8N32_102252 [Rhodovulum imhoffii]|uniref:Uncharacterized protein n=1 Tax=Rhodovulum imhoffii TaxID=365340 RepID=A0A2T5BVX2_9RHOB|nr:hypothetical protein C8N32_102252 [Rhodovulum imhoffii]
MTTKRIETQLTIKAVDQYSSIPATIPLRP